MGTGPWKLEKYTPNVGVTYTKNPDYWDKSRQPLPDRNEIKYYEEEDAAILGMQGGELDLLAQFSAVNGKALLTDPNVSVIELRAAQHRQVHMRTDQEPFNDKRVRQAVALLINRDNVVKGLLEEKADYGNDSPFAPVYKSTDTSVPQRKQDVEKAKALLAEAGKENFSVELRTWRVFEVPQYAALIQNDLKAAGIDVKLNVTDAASYYGDAVYGKSPWLDSTFGITEYGHRGVPNVFLGAPLKSDGTWNSAHFKNKEYDRLVTDYIAALDLQSQRAAAKKIQEMLLDEMPIIFSYFYFYLTATKPDVGGMAVSAMGQVDVIAGGPEGLSGGPRSREEEPAIARFLAKRVALGLITLLLLSIIVFFAAQVLPGDVGRRDPRPVRRSGAVDALNEELGANEPLLTQYWDWFSASSPATSGESLSCNRPVSDVLVDALVDSAKLGAVAFIIVVPLAILGGVDRGA